MKKQFIGFDRELNLSWLDLTAGMVQTGLDLQQIRRRLQTRLESEITGPEACQKTITLLTRLWVRVPAEHQSLHAEALSLLPNVLPAERLWLHWGMTLLAYPFFYEVAATVGQLLRLQGEFESLQIRQRMREKWGQRSTMDRAILRVIQTFLAWNVIQPINPERRIFGPVTPCQTTDQRLSLWFIESLIRSIYQVKEEDNAQLLFGGLIQSPAIFPFDLITHLTTIRQSKRFEISHQGMDLEMITLR